MSVPANDRRRRPQPAHCLAFEAADVPCAPVHTVAVFAGCAATQVAALRAEKAI